MKPGKLLIANISARGVRNLLSRLMTKKLTFWAFLFAVMASAVSCNPDDNGKTDPVDDDTIVLMNSKCALSEIDGTSYFTLELTNATSVARGERLSLVLTTFDNIPYEGVKVPATTYEYQELVQNNGLLKDDSSYYNPNDADDPDNDHAIAGGSVKIEHKDDVNYSVTGTVEDADGNEFKFKFNGRITVKDDREKPLPEQDHDVTVAYSNRFIGNKIFAYEITMTEKATGDLLVMELFAPATDLYSNYPTGDYTFSSVSDQPDAFKINSGKYSYYKASDGENVMLADGSVTLGVSGKYYTLNGQVLTEEGKRIKLSYIGKLDITRADLIFTKFNYQVVGQLQYYTSFQYYFMLTTGAEDGVGEDLRFMPCAPTNTFYEYFPIWEGRYDVQDEWPDPKTITTDEQYSENTLRFRGMNDENKAFRIASGGYMDLVTSKVEIGERFNISGQFTFEETATEPALTVNYSYVGVVEGPDRYWHGAHPYSTAGYDREFHFTEGIYWRAQNDYWASMGAPEEMGYILLTMKTAEGSWFEWQDTNLKNKEHYFMHIALNIDPMTPAEEIPTGTFTIDSDWKFAKNTFIPGSKWGLWGNIFQSTVIFNGMVSEDVGARDMPFGHGKGDGKIVISYNEQEQEYEIVFDCYDDKGTSATNGASANRIYGTFKGTFVSESTVRTGLISTLPSSSLTKYFPPISMEAAGR